MGIIAGGDGDLALENAGILKIFRKHTTGP